MVIRGRTERTFVSYPSIIHENVNLSFCLDDSRHGGIDLILFGDVEGELMYPVAGEVTHGFQISCGCIDGASSDCESFAPVATSNVIMAVSNVMSTVVEGKHVHTHKEKPIPPLEHPVTRTTVLLLDMIQCCWQYGEGYPTYERTIRPQCSKHEAVI